MLGWLTAVLSEKALLKPTKLAALNNKVKDLLVNILANFKVFFAC